MLNSLSDGNKNVSFGFTGRTLSGGLIRLVTIVDLCVIVPFVTAFVAYNLKAMASLSLPESVFIMAFILYLPIAILFAGRLLGKEISKNGKNDSVLSLILFFILSFSVFGIYMPSVQKLASMIPSLQMLNLAGSVVVLLNLYILLKNGGRIFR
ncbi:MAG: hypothetical protein QXL01_07540 [Thermoplasmatales archaeon]